MVARKLPTNMNSLQIFEDKASKLRFSAWQSFYTTTYIYQEMGEQNQLLQF